MDSLTVISGNNEDNILTGTDGTDILLGKNGDDVLDGGAGNDLLLAGNGDDQLDGGAGNDLLLAGNGDDLLDGGDGNDVLLAGNGDDQLDGGAGNDLLLAGKGDDLLDGGDGNDLLLAGKGADQLDGGAGNDVLDGGKGDDYLDGGAGSDIVFGGKGDDTFNYTLSENIGETDYYNGGKGFDTLQLTLTSAELLLAQGEIDAFQAFLASGGPYFQFESFNLIVRNFEALELNIIDGNAAPVAVGDIYDAFEDVALVIAGPGVLGNDADAENSPLTATLVTGPTNGSVTLNADGSFTYTPDADFFGDDSFTYMANDGALDSNVATVTVNVAGRNDAPVAAPDSFDTDEDVAISGNVLGNDKDVDGDALTAALVDGPKNGQLIFNGDGSFTYTPDADFFGEDSFTYTASDGLESDTAAATLRIAPVNDAPVAGDDTVAGSFTARIKVAVVGSDDPANNGVSSYVAAAAQLDPALFNATAIAHTATADWATILAGFDVVVIGDDGVGADYTGSSIFKALFDFATVGGGVITTGMYANFLNEYTNPLPGGTPDPFADLITPIQSGPSSARLAPLTIGVVDQSHPITSGIDSYTADALLHDFGVALDDTPTAKTLATWTSPDGTVVRQAIAVDELGAGKTAFLGNAYMAGDNLGSSALRQDGVGQFADQIFERAVTWAAGTRDTAATDEDSLLEILRSTLLANDSDVDGDALVIALLSEGATSKLGASLSINGAGNIEYDPRAALNHLADGVFVDDSFEYQLSDGKGGFDTATVNLKVLGVADAAASFEETVVAGLENTLAPVTSDADALL